MAVLDTKLHIKMDNATQECSIYTVESDGTPTGGIAWPVKVNGANGFIGLSQGIRQALTQRYCHISVMVCYTQYSRR